MWTSSPAAGLKCTHRRPRFGTGSLRGFAGLGDGRGWSRVPADPLAAKGRPAGRERALVLYWLWCLRVRFRAGVRRRPSAAAGRWGGLCHAHVRGGGEMGRSWWEQGRLCASARLSNDFVDVADALAHDGALGLVDGRRIVKPRVVSQGTAAGAVYSQRPDRWRAVVAEVPFVDVVTAMSDTRFR